MIFAIVSSIISLAIISLIMAGILQLASRVVNGQAIAYGDAFNATFGVLLVSNLLDLVLWTPIGFADSWVLLVVSFLLWWIALTCWVGLTVGKATLTAVVFMVLTALIMLAFSVVSAGIASLGG